MMEVWRDIRGYEGMYQVSDRGRVRSIDRRVVNHKSGSTRIVHGMILNPFDNGNGYLVVGLHNRRKTKNHYVHRLVADAFLERSENENHVNHKDYNTHNNSAENLEWCTQQHNVNHSVEHMKKPRSRSRPSNTGEKYVCKRINRSGSVSFRVSIPRYGIDKSFGKLDDAICYRNEVMKKWQSQ